MQSLAIVNSAVSFVGTASHQPGPGAAPPMDVLMVLGFLTALLTLLFWMHQRQFRSAVMGLAICLAAMAVFGFLAGAWPLGLIIFAWSASTFSRWRNERDTGGGVIEKPVFRAIAIPGQWDIESRITRIRSELN